MLTVLSRGSKNKSGNYRWWCQCSCGSKPKEVNGSQLTSHNTKSCGCLVKKRPYEWVYSYLLLIAKRKHNKVSFDYEHFLSFTKIKSCYYCGGPVEWNAHCNNARSVPMRYNLDRVNNDKPYNLENVVVCCGLCNKIKGTKTPDEFKKVVNHCNKIYENLYNM
jgi:hypothetical protein